MAVTNALAEKVVAYITNRGRLLVFRHTQFAEAGIQVPAGTVEPGEPLEEAVLREAHEETGLDGLEIQAYLGVQDVDWPASGYGTQRQHFFHLTLEGDAPETWLHYEMTPSDGSPAPIKFEFFWVRLPEQVPELAGDQGALLHWLTAGRG
jgi:8-oxo-dGTP pyrophosphatase MutT (NUDIX family)